MAEILVRYVSCDGRFSHLHYYHLWLLLALKGFKINLPFYLLQSLKKMAHSVQTTIGNPDRSLFHHGLIKILIQHQLSLSCKSWDEFLVECKLGPTQYWPNPPPKTHRKWKAPVKSKIGDVHEAESKDKELQEVNPPISTCISDDGVVNVAPCYVDTTLDGWQVL